MKKKEIDTRIQGNNPDGINRTRGNKLLIPHPSILLQHALDYMAEVDAEPLQVADAIRSGNNAGQLFYVPKQRPYTANGFGVYLVDKGVVGAFRTFLNYWHNSSGNCTAFVDTVDYIKNKMFAQKFEGAAAGIFNYAIIAAELGLKTQTEHTEKTINLEVDVSQLSDAALEEIERVAASQQQ